MTHHVATDMGRLYSWDDAMSMCGQFGNGWRSPTKNEWQRVAKHFGGLFNDGSNCKDAYIALRVGGASQFNTLFIAGGYHQSNLREC